MLANEINEEYGLTGQYLVDYCVIYGTDYEKLETINDKNPVKSELLYLYKNASVSRYILSVIPNAEIENILLSIQEDFSKDWQEAGGGNINLQDIATIQLQQKWELIYLVLATYIGKVESRETHIEPVQALLHSLVLEMQLNNLPDTHVNSTIH